MADNNEKLEKDLQNQEADIEVDVTKDVVEGIEEQPKKEEVQKEPTDNKQKEFQKEEPRKEEKKESEEEKNKEEDKRGVKEEPQEKVPEELGKKEDKGTKDESAGEPEGDKTENTGDNTDKTKIEDVTDESSGKEKERQLTEQLEAYKESEQLRELAVMRHQAESQLNAATNQVQEALIKTIKKYDIPEDKTMEELKAESPEKAAILEGLLMKAQEVIQDTSMQLSAQVEEKAKDILFNKAGKMFDAYKMTEEQANIAATTFINIMNQVGINDLGEDLAAKVKLSVAQAKMDIPDAVEAAQVKEAVKVEEKNVQNDAVKEKVPTVEEPKAGEEVVKEMPPAEEDKKVEEQKPDISEFMEGIEGNAAKASDVNTDNVLAKLNALPFKERTKFYKENMDLINEAMRKARGQA